VTSYEITLLREATIAKVIAWLLWLASLVALIWWIVGGLNGWVTVVLFLFASWASATEGKAEQALKALHEES
jgi:hypothetical protein